MEFHNTSDFAFPTESSEFTTILNTSKSLHIACAAIAIVLGVPLKALVIYIGVRHHQVRPCALYVLVISLMIAGLCMLLLVLPFNTSAVVKKGWIFGNTFCKIYGYVLQVLMYVLPFHILCITFILLSEAMLPDFVSILDKCVVTWVAVIILWTVGFLANIPYFMRFDVPVAGFHCVLAKPDANISNKLGEMLYFAFVYGIPIFGITYCTTVTILYTMATSSGDYVQGTNRTRRGLAITSFALTLATWVLYCPLPMFNLVSQFRVELMTHTSGLVFDILYLCKHAAFPVIVAAILLLCVGDYLSICKSIFRSAFGLSCRSRSREDTVKTTAKEEETQNIMNLETV